MQGINPATPDSRVPPAPRASRQTDHARSPGGRGLLLGAVAIIVAVCVFVLNADYQREVDYKRAAVAEQARAILNAVAAGINAHVRRGSEVMDNRLNALMQELVDGTVAQAVRIQVSDGQVIAEAGEVGRIAEPEQWASPNDEAWPDSTLITFAQRVESLGGGAMGRSHAPMRMGFHWSTLPEGPYDVLIVMSVSDLQDQTNAALLRTVWLGLAVCVVMMLLVNGFVAMQRRRALETELTVAKERAAHQAKLAQLSAGLAHETKNPLGVVRGLAQSIGGEPDTSVEARQMAYRIVDEVDRTVGQLNSFLTFAKPADPLIESVALDELVEGLLPLFEAEGDDGVAFGYEPSHIHVRADRNMLRRALLNLAINAVKACDGEGKVSIAAGNDRNGVVLKVSDTGVGIAPEDLPRVKDPYFTRFPGGTGLGLAIVHGIADAHRWKIEITSQLGSGTTVSLAGLEQVG